MGLVQYWSWHDRGVDQWSRWVEEIVDNDRFVVAVMDGRFLWWRGSVDGFVELGSGGDGGDLKKKFDNASGLEDNCESGLKRLMR